MPDEPTTQFHADDETESQFVGVGETLVTLAGQVLAANGAVLFTEEAEAEVVVHPPVDSLFSVIYDPGHMDDPEDDRNIFELFVDAAEPLTMPSAFPGMPPRDPGIWMVDIDEVDEGDGWNTYINFGMAISETVPTVAVFDEEPELATNVVNQESGVLIGIGAPTVVLDGIVSFVSNHGTIQMLSPMLALTEDLTEAEFAAIAAIGLVSELSAVVNSGDIWSQTSGIYAGNRTLIDNDGTIFGANAGIIAGSADEDGAPAITRIENTGTITGATGILAFTQDEEEGGIAFGLSAHAGHHGPEEAASLRILNEGTIRGTDGVAVLVSPEADLALVNTGIIDGSIVSSGEVNEIVLAGGEVNGDILLGGDLNVVTIETQLDSAMGVISHKSVEGEALLDLGAMDRAVWIDLEYFDYHLWTRGDFDIDAGTWERLADVEGVDAFIGTAGADHFAGSDRDELWVFHDHPEFTGDEDGIEYADGRGGVDSWQVLDAQRAYWISLDFDGVNVWTKDDTDLATGEWREVSYLMNFEEIGGGAYADDMVGDENDQIFLIDITAAAKGEFEYVHGLGGVDEVDFAAHGDDAIWVDLSFSGTAQAWSTGTGLAHGDATGGGANPWFEVAELHGIENITGSAGDDFLGGDDGNNVISTGGGSDSIYGRGGADVFVFEDDDTATSNYVGDMTSLDTIDLSDISAITSFNDLLENHLTESDDGFAMIFWENGEANSTIELAEVTVAQVIGDDMPDLSENFVFAAPESDLGFV
ncbi:MAG: hypothetical protein ACU0CO_00970 [Shimia sp.]